jgi:hypothetical protein
VVCFFKSAQKFKTRYATLGFSDKANLDGGVMWPTDLALKELTANRSREDRCTREEGGELSPPVNRMANAREGSPVATIGSVTLDVDDATIAGQFYGAAFGLDAGLGLRHPEVSTARFRGFTPSLLVGQPDTVDLL